MSAFGLSFTPADHLGCAYDRLLVERVRELSGETRLAEAIDRGRGDLLADLALTRADHQRAA